MFVDVPFVALHFFVSPVCCLFNRAEEHCDMNDIFADGWGI